MDWDQISPVEFTPWKSTWQLNEIQAMNSKSISESPVFSEVEKMAYKVKSDRENTLVSLKLEDYRKTQEELNKESDKFEKLFVSIDGFGIKTMPSDLDLIAGDSIKLKMNEDYIEALQSDNYVYQAVDIVEEMK